MDTNYLVVIIVLLVVCFFIPPIRKGMEDLANNKFPALMTIYFIIGIVAYTLAYLVFDEPDNIAHVVLIKGGDLFFIGALLGFITNSARFLKSVKQVIVEEAFSANNLKNLKNKNEIWRNMSRVVFKATYPKIATEILNIIEKEYFSPKVKGYYENYHIEYHFSYDSSTGYANVTENISFVFLAPDLKQCLLDQSASCAKKNQTDSNTSIVLKSFKIDGIDQTNSIKQTQSYEKGYQKLDYSIQVSKSDKYAIEETITKTYKFDDDYDLSFSSKRIANNLSAVLHYNPNEIAVVFKKVGTVNDYKSTVIPNCHTADYKGVILPKQGYSFLLRKI